MNQLGDRSIDEMAARWVARMDADTWTKEDDASLDEWVRRDPRNHGALVHAQAIWTMLSENQEQMPLSQTAKIAPARLSRRGLLIGAGTAVAASLVGGIYLLGPQPDFSTGIGEVRRLSLDDGSIAAINTNSRIKVALAETTRVVRLERGEAWFQVRKDAQRPFIVEAGAVRVQAVGTAFAVRRKVDGVEIVVTEGVVEAWTTDGKVRKVELAAGTSAYVRGDAIFSLKADGTDGAERSLAWRSGQIDLVGTRVDAAIAEINRYNKRQIVLADPILATEQFDGVFQTNDPEGFARVVAGSFGRSVDVSDPKVITINPR